MKSALSPICLLLPMITVSASAAELVDWNLDTVTGPFENNAVFEGVPASTADVAAGLEAGDLLSASSPGHDGLVWSSGTLGPNKLNLQRWDHPGDDPTEFGDGNGNPNNWLQFSLEADPGLSFTLTEFEISAWRNGGGAPADWAIEVSADGGETWNGFGSVHTENNVGDEIFRDVTFFDVVPASSLLIRFTATGPTGGSGNIHINRMVLNGSVSGTPLATVEILPGTDTIATGETVSLSPTPPDAEVRFTLDGSTPDETSTRFTEPFPLTGDTTVRAVAFNDAGDPGPVASRSYTVEQPPEPIGTPNLLVVVGDDIGFGDLQANGGVNIATPHLDSLAFDGIRFTQYSTAGPGDAASQFALLSGRVAARGGFGETVAPGNVGWGAEEWTLAEMLRRRGYATAFIGEWHLGDADGSHPNDQGFQLFHGLPHRLEDAPPLVEDREVLEADPDPANLLAQMTGRARNFIAAAETPFALVFQVPALDADGDSLAGPHGDRVEALDRTVGELLDELELRSLAADTLVLFLSDGGAPRDAGGGSNGIFRDGAGTTWEGGLRVPLLARLPGELPAGQMNLAPLWLPDLLPTLAAAVDGELAPDRPLDGTGRLAVLRGDVRRPVGGETSFSHVFENGEWRLATVREGGWKSHLPASDTNLDPDNDNPTSGDRLYDLHVDAEERINRAGGEPGVLGDLQTLADDHAASLPAVGETDLPAPKDPVEGEISTRLAPSAGPLGVRYEFVRPADSLDDHFRLEHSLDLMAWDAFSITPFVTSGTALPGHREQLEVEVPADFPPFDGEPSGFVRLAAERPATP